MPDYSYWLTNIIAIIILLIFTAIERKLRVDGAALSMKPTTADNRSTAFVTTAFITSLLFYLAAILFNINGFAFVNTPSYIGYVGIVFMVLGLCIRVIAARTLGRFYTRILKTVENQQIITNGIYKYIRHPGYLGAIIMLISVALASRNYLCLIICASLVLSAYVHRIHFEEQMLSRQFGPQYDLYKKSSYKLLPWIF